MKSINIWTDYWISGQKNLSRLDSFSQSHEADTCVDILVNPNTRSWDVEKVYRLLHPYIAMEVKKKFLLTDLRADRHFWEHEKNGEYNVRSGFRMCGNLDNANRNGESSVAANQVTVWRKLWKMAVPNKIKVFAWRVCKDGLPTKHNLRQRKVMVEEFRPFCQVAKGDIYYALFECPEFLHTRNNKYQHFFRMVESGMMGLLRQVQRAGNLEEVEKLFLIAWGFWNRRNQMVFEMKVLHLSLYVGFKEPRGRRQEIKLPRITAWTAPNIGELKLNVNGAIFPHEQKTGIGYVLRDGQGRVVMAASKCEEQRTHGRTAGDRADGVISWASIMCSSRHSKLASRK